MTVLIQIAAAALAISAMAALAVFVAGRPRDTRYRDQDTGCPDGNGAACGSCARRADDR